MGALVMVNAALIPLILFYGQPKWLWRSTPVNFFQKNPVVDHYVPPALFISSCQWIYNIILQYLGGSSSTTSIVHSSQALWLIPLILVGTFFISAFAHWALFLCYNQVKQQHRQQYHARHRQWKTPLLGLWGALCLLLARIGMIILTIVQGGYWSIPIGILLAVPETMAMSSVIYFFIKTSWQSFRNARRSSSKAINNNGLSGGSSDKEINSPSSPTAPLWDATSSSILLDDPHDDFTDLSSANHRAYVKSLLVPEQDLRDAAGSMYGQSTIGSNRTSALFHKATTSSSPVKPGDGGSSRYMGSTLNTTISMASSTATDFSRNPTEFEFNVLRDGGRRLPPLSPSANYGRGSRQFPFDQPGQQQQPYQQQGYLGFRRSNAPSEKSTAAPASTRSGLPNRPRPSTSREGLSVHKLTWNSATTSYTSTSAAQPMTGAAPTPSAWEYVVYPKRLVWPTIVGTYLLIARLPLRILVAVLTTLVLCYDVLLSIGAAETVLAVPVSCHLGGIAYPGPSQFDNTMNVARAMHTVNLVLIVVLLPTIVVITLLHQIRMVQKYNWCLRLLRTGNYGFVPGGREYTQHLKHPVRFIGYTVGFGVVGLCFTIFLLFTLCTLVAMLLVAATFRSSIFRTLGSRALAAFGISCLLVLILWIVQMLVIRYRFRMPGSRFLLPPQQSTRASFQHWEFFWAFFNIVFGALSFFKRIVLSVLSMGVYSTRIDLCIMGSRFRPWDGGYSAFVGLVLADHVLNNPIVLEFVQILRDLLLIRRHPSLAHYFLEGRERSHLSDGPHSQDPGASALQDRRLMLQMINLQQQQQQQQRGGPSGGKKGVGRPLDGIEEGEEASMDQLLMASGAGVGAGIAVKGGAVVPEVSKIHHYFRVDPRVDRHSPGQGPLPSSSSSSPSSSSSSSPPPAYNNNNHNNRVSKVYTPLTATTDDTGNKQGVHVKLQDPHLDPESAVSQEQIRQKLDEAKLRSIRARNRWFLYLTLARNPSLCSLRRTKAKDFLHPIGRGADHAGSHEEEFLADIQWDRED
ncbi:MAG: retinol binding protein receptor-domain-containing protein [Benniella sp.]|nr:MAG: retinol binding protein receptor-domain-containing protein [Benniella sp.]